MPFCARPLCAAGCFRAYTAHSRCRCGVHLFPQREPLPPHFPHNSTGQTRHEPHSFFSQKHQMKNPFPRLCLPQPSYPRRKVPLMPAPESSSHTLAGAFPPAPVATISPLSLTFCFCLLILCSNIKGGIVMKNFALTLALLSAAVLSPAATPSPGYRCGRIHIATQIHSLEHTIPVVIRRKQAPHSRHKRINNVPRRSYG